jgi:hypothetical protein
VKDRERSEGGLCTEPAVGERMKRRPQVESITSNEKGGKRETQKATEADSGRRCQTIDGGNGQTQTRVA